MIVCLDPGHGGKDSGALGNNLKEKDINLSVALKIGKILERHNIKVVYTRITDVFIELSERANIANKANVDVFVSIHCNSFTSSTAQGLETYSYPGSATGTRLAKDVHDSVVKDKLYTKDRGLKTKNLAVLRETKMPATLVELGFISNAEDATILKNKQDELAHAVAKGILQNLGVKYIENNTELLILSETKATVEQMKIWARNKGANQTFIDLAPLFYNISEKAGVNPLVTFCQSAKETGYMKFGGVLDITYNNPCGLKITQGGGDKDPNAHKRFKNWNEGIQAQVDHLALYAGATGYPKIDTPDPRHFPYLLGKCKTVESLSGNWAPSTIYGQDIIHMIEELQSTIVEKKTEYEKAVDVLSNVKIINSTGFWKENKDKNVQALIIKMAAYITQGV